MSRLTRVAAGLVFAALLVPGLRGAAPTYFPDDPIAVDPETRDAAAIALREISDPFDFIENTFLKPADASNQRAVNVNTIDEVPDSSWFTNRSRLTVDDYVRGPNTSGGPAPGAWTVVSGKSDGITPGFTVRDSAGTTWFIKFDPPSNPEMATGAEIIATKLFWAAGYHVPENYLAVLDPATLTVDARATMRDAVGTRQPLTRDGVDRRKIQETMTTISEPSTKPSIGETKMKSTVFRMPAEFSAPAPALATTAPTMPPISACDELLGMP